MFKNKKKNTCSVLCALTHLSSLSSTTAVERIDQSLNSTLTSEDIYSHVDTARYRWDEGFRKFVDTVHIGSRLDCRGMLQKEMANNQ